MINDVSEYSTAAWVYRLILMFAEDHKGNSPTLLQIVNLSKKKGRSVSKSSAKLQIDNMIAAGTHLEKVDGCIMVIGSCWYPPGEADCN